MKDFIDIRDFKIEEPTIVTLGKFDGRHVGHQKLLREMKELKEIHGWKIAVFTFHTTPNTVVRGNNQTVITTNRERRNNMEKMGVDYLVEYPFSDTVSHMSAEDFVKIILVEKMNARAVVVGTDCAFGYQRSGNAALLKELSQVYGYQVTIVEKAQDDNRDISSTYVREELDQGNIEKANELLGEPYSIHGVVVHGNHIGAPILGFPTANILPPPEKHLPPFGVYVSQVALGDSLYGGITNIGRKPTIEGNYPIGIETYIFGLHDDIYGSEIEVKLLTHVRPEKKFNNLDELKQQIEKDKEYGQHYLASCGQGYAL